MHKPAQVELQLDRSQLPYLETFGPITVGGSPAQRTICKKGPYIVQSQGLVPRCLDLSSLEILLIGSWILALGGKMSKNDL